MPSPFRHVFVAVVAGSLFTGALTTTTVLSQTSKKQTADEKLKASMDAFWNAEYPAAEKLAQGVVAQKDAGKEELVEAHKCLACVYVMQDAHRKALESLTRMFQLDPTARFSPDANYPPPVIHAYYSVRDSLFAGTVDLKTIAVGDFENNSVYTGKFGNHDFGALAKALPHVITLDLTEATDLKVVDRQRTAEILKELAITTSGMADPKSAVQVGKLLGAHAYIFGQYMLLSADKVRIDARIVRTATGEIVTAKSITADFGGKPETFLEIEKKLVTEIMATLDETMGSGLIDNPGGVAQAYFEKKSKRLAGRNGYVEGIFLTSEALKAEESGDYKEAIGHWKKVLATDPGNDVAATRIKLLEQTLKQG
jgi:TolB-like protein